MDSKKEVRARAVVRDLRSGSKPAEIMEKYKLSDRGFRSVLRKLVVAGLLNRSEVKRFEEDFPGLFVGDLRLAARKAIRYPLLICDVNAPESKGFVRNISRKGLAVEGVDAPVGEIMALKVLSSELAECSTFVFEAKCVWSEDGGTEDTEPVAGFEITSITKSALKELQKLI
jgi:hypothetical protein